MKQTKEKFGKSVLDLDAILAYEAMKKYHWLMNRKYGRKIIIIDFNPSKSWVESMIIPIK